jgi:hypothetical protein
MQKGHLRLRAPRRVDLSTLTREWEAREEAISLESYKQYAGLDASEETMERLAGEVERLTSGALAAFPRAELPPLLWQALVAARGARETTRLQNEVYRLRNEAVVAEVAGEKVNLNNVRLFNQKHLREPKVRQAAFDALLSRAKALTPALRARFRLSAAAWKPFGMTPLDAYLVEEQVTLPRLRQVVDDAARAAKPAFLKAADEFAREILGKPFEYYDDMYVFRLSVFSPLDPAFAHVDPVQAFAKLARRLGFRPEDILIDGEARPGKFSSPICFGVRIPGDVRVLYQRATPISDHESFYHEMGHALHFASVERERRFDERRLIPNGVAEIFSTLFEEVGMDPLYLREDLGLPADVVEEIERRRRFMELTFLTFYGANSMHKIEFWTRHLYDDLDAADHSYAELCQRYLGVRMPGIYWQTHHVLSMSDVYAPSYLLANIRKSEMLRALEREFGRAWWRDARAGAWLRAHAMGPGASIDLASFSRLDASAYVDPIVKGRAA